MKDHDLELRPVRAEDRPRLEEISRGVWDGRDYLPAVFDEWLADPSSSFQAAELDGVVVGVQRLRPLGPGLAWYEGLRVATEARRQGVARTMLEAAVDESRRQGVRELRLATASEAAKALFESAGFQRRLEAVTWQAGRMEGDEPAAIPDPSQAELLAGRMREDGSAELYSGLIADPDGAVDLEAEVLRRQAGEGRLRSGPGGRALAVIRPSWGGRRLWATFVGGRGGVLRDLLLALRFEADVDGLDGATLWLPRDDPRARTLEEVGYDCAIDPFEMTIYALHLQS